MAGWKVSQSAADRLRPGAADRCWGGASCWRVAFATVGQPHRRPRRVHDRRLTASALLDRSGSEIDIGADDLDQADALRSTMRFVGRLPRTMVPRGDTHQLAERHRPDAAVRRLILCGTLGSLAWNAALIQARDSSSSRRTEQVEAAGELIESLEYTVIIGLIILVDHQLDNSKASQPAGRLTAATRLRRSRQSNDPSSSGGVKVPPAVGSPNGEPAREPHRPKRRCGRPDPGARRGRQGRRSQSGREKTSALRAMRHDDAVRSAVRCPVADGRQPRSRDDPSPDRRRTRPHARRSRRALRDRRRADQGAGRARLTATAARSRS